MKPTNAPDAATQGRLHQGVSEEWDAAETERADWGDRQSVELREGEAGVIANRFNRRQREILGQYLRSIHDALFILLAVENLACDRWENLAPGIFNLGNCVCEILGMNPADETCKPTHVRLIENIDMMNLCQI